MKDYFPPEFVDDVLAQHPAPIHPETGEPLWEKGIRLHGAQRGLVCDPYRYKKADGGIRFGKSFAPAVVVYLDFLWRVITGGRDNELWGFLGDSYEMAQEEMNHLHRLFTEAQIPHDFRTPKNQVWTITFKFTKSYIRTLTAADITKIAARAYRGIVLTEASQITDAEAWHQARLRTSQLRGWVMMSGTFENQRGPWYAQMTHEWKEQGALSLGMVYECPSWENPIAYPGGREDPEILQMEATLPPDLFQEKFGGVPRKPSNIVFREAEADYQVKRRFPHLGTSFDPEKPVYLFIDPGVGHAYAVFAAQPHADRIPDPDNGIRGFDRLNRGNESYQRVEQTLWLIDVVYRWGRETEQVIDECVSQPWADNVYVCVLDVAARQRNANGRPVIEQWAKLWREKTNRRIYVYAERVDLMAGYEIHRRCLLNTWPEQQASMAFNTDGRSKKVTDPEGPKLYIDPDAAKPLFGGTVDSQRYTGEYKLHKYAKAPDGTITKDIPIDLNNDAIKAINYGLMWYYKAGRRAYLWNSAEPQTQEFAVVRG